MTELRNIEAERATADLACSPTRLTDHIKGTLAVAFTDGGTLNFPCTQAFATGVISRWRRLDPGDNVGDEWVWTDDGSFSINPEKVGAIWFKRSIHAGWWDAPAETKAALAENGYGLGIMNTIIEQYQGRPAPKFSLIALHLVQEIAALPGITHDEVVLAILDLENADVHKYWTVRGQFGDRLIRNDGFIDERSSRLEPNDEPADEDA